MSIIYLPLEPFELRYTDDWYTEFPKEFKKSNLEYQTIDGKKLVDEIETGRFLDVFGTIYWKSTQMANIAQQVRKRNITNKDIIFDADLWHPGLESLSYMTSLANIDIKIVGVLHAGLWDKHDFLSQSTVKNWGYNFEKGWIEIADIIFVATKFHKQLIEEYFKVTLDKIKVTGLPFYGKRFKTQDRKRYDIVFPHRLDPEKRPQDFEKVRFGNSIRTMDYMNSSPLYDKEWYYKILNSSKVAFSSATQETFGYAMLEATACGCIPIVPNRLSYKEIYPEKYRYDTLNEAKEMIHYYLKYPEPCPEITYKFENSIQRMIEWLPIE